VSNVDKHFKPLSLVGWGFFLLWIGWNIYWWSKGYLAPSPLMHFFNIPVSSTGMTRSLTAMANGQWKESLLWNVFTVPILIIFTLSIIYLFWNFLKNKRLKCLPKWMAVSWLVILTAGQIAKFIIGPSRW